jgi:streptogramin lyase
MSVHTEIEIGSEFVGYRLEELVGRGGMGVVYRASDLRLKRTVALKLMAPELALDDRFRLRFARESELAMSLEHPNVVPIHDAGEADGRLYLAMRFVEGTDLKALLRGGGALAPDRAVAIVSQIANALDGAHASGLVHRDVKPSNVLLDPDEHVYLADFGLTRRLTDTEGSGDGRSLGTPAYLAPEQIEGGEVDGRADVYSLGCLVYECLTGEAPFAHESRLAVAWAHLEQPPPRPTKANPALTPAIDDVVRRAMAKEPADRYSTCSELAHAVQDALGLDAGTQRGRRARLAAAVLAAVTALTALGAALADWRGGTAAAGPEVRANTLVRIDPATNEIDAVIDVGEDPYFTAAAGDSVWVYNYAEHSVSEVDAVTNELLATTALKQEAATRGSPLITADSRGAWVIGRRPGTIDYLLTRVRADGAGKRVYELEVDARGVAVGEGSVWVLGRSPIRGNVLDRMDPATGKVIGRTLIPSEAEVETLTVGEGAVWAIDSVAELFRIDARSGKVTARRDLGECAAPPVVGFRSVWICACNPGSALMRLDTETLRPTLLRNAIPAQNGLFAVGRDSLWWHDEVSGTVVRFDAEDGRLRHTIRVSPKPPTPGIRSLTAASITTGSGAVWVTAALLELYT